MKRLILFMRTVSSNDQSRYVMGDKRPDDDKEIENVWDFLLYTKLLKINLLLSLVICYAS